MQVSEYRVVAPVPPTVAPAASLEVLVEEEALAPALILASAAPVEALVEEEALGPSPIMVSAVASAALVEALVK